MKKGQAETNLPSVRDLDSAKATLAKIDRRAAELFEERMRAVRMIAEEKIRMGIPVDALDDAERSLRESASHITEEALLPLYVGYQRQVLRISKDYERQLAMGMRIAFNGEPGAFADTVAHRVFPEAVRVPYPDFPSAYRAVENGECACALLPIENSFHGDVGTVMDLAFFGSLSVNGIYQAQIVQNLLGVPGSTVNGIRKVISHPQALGQCAAFLQAHGYETEEAVSTSAAAKTVAERGKTDLAAIASAEAAERFGLVKLETHINDSSSNSTRFAVFAPYPKHDENADRFVLLFTVKDSAGSLGEAVSVIGKHGFNLRALKSRPTKELVWNYYFYAEGDGNIESAAGKQMLDELRTCCNTLRILGSFGKETSI